MASRKYLIVSRSFYPTNSPRANRTTELAKELCRQGHQVRVIAPAHPKQRPLQEKYGFLLTDLGPTWPEIPTGWGGKKRMLLRIPRRVVLQTIDYPNIQLFFKIPRLLKEIETHDVLISIAAPHSVHWGVAAAYRKGISPGTVWIADCGDPFMGLENDTFRKLGYFGVLEKSFCRRADWITVPTEESVKGYYSEFHGKIRVVPQGFRFRDYEYLKNASPINDGVLRFAYAGLFIQGRRDPRPLLEYITQLDRKFEFHVYSKDMSLVESFARNDPRIRLHGFVEREKLLLTLSQMDFLLSFEYPGKTQTPSKLIDYWLCNRPILNLKSDQIQTEVLDQFFSGNYENALKIERPERYEIGNIVRQFHQLAEEARRRKHGGEG